MCQYLERFYTYKKISNIFLKVHLYLLKLPKIIEIGKIAHAEKCMRFKHITNTHKNRFGSPLKKTFEYTPGGTNYVSRAIA